MSEEWVYEAGQIVSRGRWWIKFLAIYGIVSGSIACVTIVGAIVGWVPIWIGCIMLRMCKEGEQIASEGSEYCICQYVEQMSRLFRICGILTVIGVVFECLMMGGQFIIPILKMMGH